MPTTSRRYATKIAKQARNRAGKDLVWCALYFQVVQLESWRQRNSKVTAANVRALQTASLG